MPFLIPLVVGGIGGAWWTKETVEAVTGGEGQRVPYWVYAALLVAGYVWAKKRGYL